MKKTIKPYFQQCKKTLKSFEFSISNILVFLALSLIKFYTFFISPLLGTRCRYLPTCSEYCQESFKIHGLIKGSFLSLKRILKCHPVKFLGGGHGIDFVPGQNKKLKRLY